MVSDDLVGMRERFFFCALVASLYQRCKPIPEQGKFLRVHTWECGWFLVVCTGEHNKAFHLLVLTNQSQK
jgi:hypothetical protein